ncbi:MAG: hypothetical protein OEY23_23095 [Acidimicrobiia bacterium]|nr:hypothetical protein [Acidimicrobiia bacterium]
MEHQMMELASEDAQVLPAREALGVFDWAGVYAVNDSQAVNFASTASSAVSLALQGITVVQS